MESETKELFNFSTGGWSGDEIRVYDDGEAMVIYIKNKGEFSEARMILEGEQREKFRNVFNSEGERE